MKQLTATVVFSVNLDATCFPLLVGGSHDQYSLIQNFMANPMKQI